MVFVFHHVNVLGSNPYHWKKKQTKTETTKNVESQMHGRFYHLLILLFLKIYFYLFSYMYMYVMGGSCAQGDKKGCQVL